MMNNDSSRDMDLSLFTDAMAQTIITSFEILTAERYVLLNEIVSMATIIIALAGVVGNAVNIKTFLMMGIEDGVSATFLALSFADFSYTFAIFVQAVASILESFERRFGYVFTLDPFVVMFFGVNVGIAISSVVSMTTTYLAVVRCLCVAKPLHFKAMFTKFKSSVILATFPIVVLVSHVPLFSNMGVTSRFDPRANSTRLVVWLSENREKVKNVTRAIFVNCVPFISLVIVIACVVIMASKLRKSVKFRQKQESSLQNDNETPKMSGKERNVIIQVVVISTVYIFINLCKMVFIICLLLEPKLEMGEPYQFLYLLISASVTACDCVNSSINFCVYFKFNSKYRSLCFSCGHKEIVYEQRQKSAKDIRS